MIMAMENLPINRGNPPIAVVERAIRKGGTRWPFSQMVPGDEITLPASMSDDDKQRARVAASAVGHRKSDVLRFVSEKQHDGSLIIWCIDANPQLPERE